MMKEEEENIVFDVAHLNVSERPISANSDDESIENERWAPIGESSDEHPSSVDEKSRLRELEEEQQRLNNSLLSLTTHFAQVQFRLKQVAQADDRDRDKLLKELQEFAFKGCADVEEVKRQRKTRESADGESEEVLKAQKERQMQLIEQLREQLADLEKFAYETGEGGIPSNELIAKQKAVLDKLHERMQLNLQLDKMSHSDLQKQVDEALKQLVNPMKAKEQLVEQLQTQIVDLERFVNFLQVETPERVPTSIASVPVARPKRNPVLNLVGCGSRRFERNELKNTVRGNHYGDVRARLELAVGATVNVCEKYLLLAVESESPRTRMQTLGSSTIDEDIFERSEEEVVWVVRKELCPALRHLLEHGMNASVVHTSAPFAPFGCFPARSHQRRLPAVSSSVHKLEHIWDIIIYYFDSKNGREFSDAPVRKLSQSFQLDSVAGRSVTSKQILLSTIENVVATHGRLKRSPDAMWKAFVSAALNEKKLPAWIRIIFRTRQIVETCFQPWAYVARTGCEDCYELLERLHKYHFELPVDLAVMQQLTDKLVSESAEYGTVGKNFIRDECLIMGTDPFRLREVQFDASMCMASNEQVTCVDGSSKFLYFGTTHGNIVRLELREDGRAEVRDVLQLPTKSAAVQLVAASAVDCLIVVSASKMFYVDINSLQVLSAGTSSNVVCIALNSDPVTEDPFALQIALATSNRMILACERSAKNSYVRQRINTDENVLAICYSRYCICYATQCEYFVYSINRNATLSLFPYQLESTKPLIVNIDTEEFLVSGMQGLAVFASSDGVSSRPPLVWGSDRVVSTVYRSPYIFALNSTSLIVFMCNEASEVHRMTVIDGTLLSNINGRIFLCVKDQIFMIDEVSWFDRAETLLAQNSVERALKLAEQSVLSASYDEEEILKMNRLKQKAALIYFRDEDFEKCSDLAISCEMDPRELMFHYAHFEFPIPPFQVSDFNVSTVGEVDTTSAKHLDFLEEHLLRVRDLHWSKPYKQDLDTALVCLLSRRGSFLEKNSVPQLSCSLNECKRWMCDRGRVPFYASLALECGDVQAGFGTCQQLLSEGQLDANLYRLCLENFSKMTDPKTVLDWLEFLLQVDAASTVRSLENLSVEVDCVEVVKHLEPYREQLIFYLERMRPLQMASLDTKLASLYIEEIVQSSQSMENDQKEIAKNYRTRLRHLLFESCNLDSEKVAHDMKRWPQFAVESVLLKGKTQASEECLERLLNDYRDYDAAELYCLHMNAKNKRLFRILLKSYLNVVKTQPEFKSRVVKMLQSINEPGDELEIISEFPDDWPLQAFSSFAAKALSTYTYRLHCDKFKTAALSMAMRHLTCELEGSTSAKIEIDDHTRCAACGTAIGSEEVALYPHSDTLVHRSCTKYSHLCPKTNTIA